MLIGLDLGDGGLIEAWARAGALPTLARLLGDAAPRALASPVDTLHVSAWPSLYTGSPPGEHGVYFTFQPVPGVQGHRRFHEGLYGRPTFWSLLDRAGVRATVFDAPYTHPEPGSGAVQLFDWGVWAKYLGERSSPPELVRRLRRAQGAYPLGLEAHDVGLDAIRPEHIGPKLVEAAAARTEAACWLLDEAPADLNLLVFGETHPGAHYLWPPGLERPGGEGEAFAVDDPRWKPLAALYREIDRGIGRILDRVPDDATVVVFSPDSIVANYGAWHLLPEVLRRLGHLHEPGPAEGSGEPTPRPGLVRRIRDLLPRDFRKSLARYMPVALRDRLARQVDTAFVDWSRTRAFCLPTDLEGLVRINLCGREPEGIVAPGDYEALCDEVSASLRRLESPAGERVVREVVRTRDRFPGARVDHLPDLIVLWEPKGQLREVRSAEVGSVVGASPDGRPGTHGAPGFLIASGPGADDWRRVQHVEDVTGIALEWFDIETGER